MENFTPTSALLGGAIIGLSALVLLLFVGRIAGISGIVSGIWSAKNSDRVWRVLFVVGLVLGCFLAVYLGAPQPAVPMASTPILILAGLLVGVGTVVGSGCTSGHGVCGMSRLSIRSIVATVIFMACGIITVWLTRA
ncbi:YeeE/YedE thiosulfate transporter family protein [Alteromonadaceae bacterium BrNp21-10]|nr:YeeE/YedE thiosulfate transporter family protein [Alteromonadaceae bacterium BrNp21-10]